VVAIKPLNDIADTVERIGSAILKAEGISGDERLRYRQVVADTFDILQQAIALPANRLTKLLGVHDQGRFSADLGGLAELDGWERLERAAYLCEPLRASGREMGGLLDSVKASVALRDRKRFRELTERLLGGEAEFAHLISSSLHSLSALAEEARSSPAGLRKARRAVERTRDRLQDLRRRLLEKQLEFYEVI
jgi:hypothetical protein